MAGNKGWQGSSSRRINLGHLGAKCDLPAMADTVSGKTQADSRPGRSKCTLATKPHAQLPHCQATGKSFVCLLSRPRWYVANKQTATHSLPSASRHKATTNTWPSAPSWHLFIPPIKSSVAIYHGKIINIQVS